MPYGKLALDTIETSGGLSVTGNVTSSGSLVATNFDSSNSLGMRNRLINGSITVDQRNRSNTQTITAGAALAYTVDRWYAYCTGANVTGQRVAGTIANTFRYQFTGAASVTAIGFGQRIEAINSADLAGTTATLSIGLSNSLLTTVTWTAFYANTTDTFGTLASPTRTQIATGTFTVNSTFTRYSTNISIPSAATTGIEVVFTVGAQTSGTWVIGDVQLEAGSVAGSFERRPIGQEQLLCFRYFVNLGGNTNNFQMICSGVNFSATGGNWFAYLPTQMRTLPTLTTQGQIYLMSTGSSIISAFAGPTTQIGSLVEGGYTCGSTTSGVATTLAFNNVSGTKTFSFSAEM